VVDGEERKRILLGRLPADLMQVAALLVMCADPARLEPAPIDGKAYPCPDDVLVGRHEVTPLIKELLKASRKLKKCFDEVATRYNFRLSTYYTK
jgi:hypothetical protein